MNERPSAWQLLLLILSIYVLVALTLEVSLSLSDSTKTILNAVDAGICVLFLLDFVIQFSRAERKLQYMKWGWLDLISSIPILDNLRWARVARITRLVRVFRTVRSARVLARSFGENRASTSLAVLVLVCFTLVLGSSLLILEVERTPDARITNPQDALWWSFATITTVGYGDLFPVTTVGRIIGAVLMTAGVGVFGTVTAAVGAWMLKPRSARQPVDREASDGEEASV